jgi:para-aminobenzoate synthetase component I
VQPYVLEIPYNTPLKTLNQFANKSGTVLLHSARYHEDFARFSFLGINPPHTLTIKNEVSYWDEQIISENPFSFLKNLLKYPITPMADLPPFQGGMMGYFSYELGGYFESLPVLSDDLGIPDFQGGWYDLVISYDHLQKRSWIVSSGWPELDPLRRQERAKQRSEWLLSEIRNAEPIELKTIHTDKVCSNFTNQQYCQAVQKIKDYIFAGDIFQANMTRRFEVNLPQEITSFEIFAAICEINPAPFAAYLYWPDLSIMSASPERFLLVQNGWVETKPIKGTRPRSNNQAEDAALARELQDSEKDQAENLMIVDLMRNDLSRVCQPHTVEVPKLLDLESYATVHHLVSTVTGQLKPNQDVIDLLQATFPGGSITGAPKIRAMEIISELEQVPRGIYCGSIGYIGFDGTADLNIAIRTYTKIGSRLIFNAGGGIVADSDPQAEYEETTTKALALLRAIGQ